MRSIVLAEKPSVAKELARVLNCHKRDKGYFEGSQYIVTWALGHLVTLDEPAGYDPKYKEWRMQDLPMLPEKMKLKVIRETSHQFRTVTQLMKRGDIDEFIIATDAGREGELVARWIMKLGGWKKNVKRLWISSQTDEAIRQGFANLKPGREYENLYRAAVCRAEADWLIGLNVTRALTCKFNIQLSAGRVQTPTLFMIIDREKEIENFIPKDYWTIDVDFGDYFGAWRNKNGSTRIFDLAQAQEIVEKVKTGAGIIMNINVETKNDPPPPAYDLTELQRDANRRFGFSAQKTLSVLQDLYEKHKLVTYPRTDSRYITTDIVPTLPLRLEAIAKGPYTALVQPLLQSKPNPGKRFVDNNKVSDHHAIIPTEQPLDLSQLDADEKRLYDLIARRFITVLYPPFKYDQTTIVTMINGERFYSRGKVITDLGWRKVTTIPPENEDEKEDRLPEQTLAQQRKGAKKIIKNCKLSKSQTKPPARYTEATLLTAMENPGKFVNDETLRAAVQESGLGTPATRAEIIEKLLSTHYIERVGKELHPTSKGKQLIDLVPPSLKSPALTAQWELRLAKISKGKEDNQKFLTDIRENAAQLVQGVREDTSTFKIDNLTNKKCPMCGKFMMVVNTKNKKGRTYICSDISCRYEEDEQKEITDFKRTKEDIRMGKRLIDRFSDNKKKNQVATLGDLFEAALKKN
ncbi:MAG: DNA topoisomerase III [Acidobacteria bacterium]|nr:DNA topoisomerase III [Acidobacteriota bacterium]